MASIEEDIIEDSDDEVDIMPSDVLQKLQESWIDERMCPEILPFETDVLDCMLDQVEQMEANLKRVNKSELKVSIHRMEVERIRFIITSYLRCRIAKIEHYNRYILDSETLRTRLSVEEMSFATEYRRHLERHLAEAALSLLPAADSSNESAVLSEFDSRLTSTESTVVPNIDSHVFVKVVENCANVLVSDESGTSRSEDVDLTKNSLYLLRYETIAKLLHKKRVHLV